MSVPNQKVLTIVKPAVPVPPFLQVEMKEWEEAMRRLSPAGQVLWTYLAANQNGYKLELSPADIADKKQLISRRSYYRAIEDLKNNKYLVDNVFYTTPPEIREQQTKVDAYVKSLTR